MITVLTKHDTDDYDVWFSEIPENAPPLARASGEVWEHGFLTPWYTL